MTILNNAILLGRETTYGTAVALARAYEGQGDGWKRKQEALQSVGMRAGMRTVRSDRRRMVNMGAEGKLELDFLNIGMGLLVQGLMGGAVTPTLLTGAAHSQVHTVNAADAATSFTIQMLRSDITGTMRQFTYVGSVATKWAISQSAGELAKLSVDFDAQNEETSTAAGTPTYPASAVPFDWTQCVVSIGGSPVDFTEVSVEADMALNTDRRFLRGSALKRQPRRAGVPTYSGKLTGEFQDMALYNAFVAGGTQSLRVEWTGALITGPHFHRVTLDCPAIQYDGDTPQASLDGLSTLETPFTILDNGAASPITLTIVSTDSAL